VFVALLIQFLIGAGVFAWATDPQSGLLVRVLTAAAPFALFPALFAWKWISMPPRLAAEATAFEFKRDLRARLAALMEEGTTIQNAIIPDANVHVIRERMANWCASVDFFLRHGTTRPDYAARFAGARGTISTAIKGLPAEAAVAFRDIQAKKDVLDRILSEIPTT
jgi:hypothetical protein